MDGNEDEDDDDGDDDDDVFEDEDDDDDDDDGDDDEALSLPYRGPVAIISLCLSVRWQECLCIVCQLWGAALGFRCQWEDQ